MTIERQRIEGDMADEGDVQIDLVEQIDQDGPSEAERRLEAEAQRLRLAGAAVALMLVIAAIFVVVQGASRAVLGEILVFGALLVAGCALTFRVAQLLIEEPLSEVVRVIFGEPLAVRNSERFLRRLKHECTDSQMRSRNRTFSLVVVGTQQVDGEPEAPVTHLRETVRASIRSRDVMGQIGSHELWVLALGAGAGAAEVLAGRLADRAGIRRDEIDRRAPRVGWSTFEVDAGDPHALMRAARYRASLFNPDESEEVVAA